jgi:aminomethyltransferase
MNSDIKRTALFEEHKRLGARMIQFAGWEMPAWYSGIIDEHHAVRNRVGLFDLSHMGEVYFKGKGALDYLQYVTTNDLAKIGDGGCQYTLLATDEGGIVDDLIVYRESADVFFAVVNASNTAKDFDWFLKCKKGDVEITNVSDDLTLLAVQGPNSEGVLKTLGISDIASYAPFTLKRIRLRNNEIIVAATGYTGERGFELIMPNDSAKWFWNKLLEVGSQFGLVPIGLGARDTLRLEACYSLYGNEIDDTTSAWEGGLGWVVKLDKGDFIGKGFLVKQQAEGIKRKIAGFTTDRKNGAPRHGSKIYSTSGDEIGVVTSGSYSPSLEVSVGLGYLPPEMGKAGNKILVEIRNKRVQAETVKTPFYKRPRRK